MKRGVKGLSVFWPYGATGTSLAMAHIKPTNSRAMATVTTAEVTNFSRRRDGHGELNTTQGLKGFNHRVQTPRFHVLLEFLFEMLESSGVVRCVR